MGHNTNLARVILVFLLAIFGAKAVFSQTSFYVDPGFAGSPRNGSASAPWQSLNDGNPWATINASLASGPVTVYFSAQSGGQPVSSNATITINRTDTGSNVLTLDGISKYNTNESSPNWAVSSSPVPCKPAAGAGPNCVWYKAPKFTITGTLPITSNASSTNCYSNITVQGFKLNRTEGQIFNGAYISNLTIQYNEMLATPGGTYGPGLFVGPANNGPCQSGGTLKGVDNVTVQYNYVHDTYEDCIYDGASTPDPPGYPSAEYTSLGETCTTACPTGANHLIQYNIIESCSHSGGGENVGINVKDGHVNHKIIGNVLQPTKDGFSPNVIGPGINLESCGLVDGNYIEAPATSAIAPALGWNDSLGRSGCTIQNNIIVNVNSGTGRNAGIEVFAPDAGANQLWQGMNLYNNTVYNAGMSSGDPCIAIDAGSTANGVVNVQNNIVDTCGSGGISIGSGLANTHDYNDYVNAGTTCPVNGEPHSQCANPQFVSTSTPYADVNFKLQSGSPVSASGNNLSSIFTDDYFGNTRTVPWDMGASAMGNATGPNPPTGLAAKVE
jgi:hypothetical protein